MSLSHYLAGACEGVRQGWVRRFRPALWSVDFPRPMMAAVTAPAADVLRVTLDFLTTSDLAGLIWSSEDRQSHPLLARETARDYRGLTLEFDWVAEPGLMPLDALFGAVLTVEGRDEAGQPSVWYVRLWNCATGSGMSARIRLDFDDLRAGFAAGGPRVPTHDLDRLFISLVPVGFGGDPGPLPEPIETAVELQAIRCDGPGSAIRIRDAYVPEHGIGLCSGYDDSYHQPPERLVEQWRALGYRGSVVHYVGMSHFPRLRWTGARFEPEPGICRAARAWHAALFAALERAGLGAIVSLSFELFADHAPAEWVQRDMTGAPGLTGWEPPSALLSPCNEAAQAWLGTVAGAFCQEAEAAGLPVRFQVGEPWWWVGPGGLPCFYDAATVARWVAERGTPPPLMADVRGGRTAAERDWLDWLGARLAEATAALVVAARSSVTQPLTSHLLFYAPQVLDRDMPELRRANMPAGWAWPAFDVLQLEDYDFVERDDEAGLEAGRRAVSVALGYPVDAQHYLAGFVLRAADAVLIWPRIVRAAARARAAGVEQRFVWAWPQIARDGLVLMDLAAGGRVGPAHEDEGMMMEGFHDVRFPLEIGFDAVGGPTFQTQVALMASGHEQRNIGWANARLAFDAGLGVRSEDDLRQLLDFFRGRMGQAYAFRFRDPMDWSSSVGDPAPGDQLLGIGDGQRLSFEIVKRYGGAAGGEVRRITHPVPESVRVSVHGLEQVGGWSLLEAGVVQFDEPPADGAEVRAGFLFDVPVRFATDRLEVSLSGWRSGEVPRVPLLEVRA